MNRSANACRLNRIKICPPLVRGRKKTLPWALVRGKPVSSQPTGHLPRMRHGPAERENAPRRTRTIRAMFHIVLVEPEIPPNTGNVIRLAANTGCTLHLIEPLGFYMNDRLLRRAGLDYHEWADVRRHAGWSAFLAARQPDWTRCFALSTRGARLAHEAAFAPGDCFIFGAETRGLPPDLLARFAPQQRLRLPMREGQRSLNLSNAVAVTVFEAWRQCGFA